MPEYPCQLAGFEFRSTSNPKDQSILDDVHRRGWSVIGIGDADPLFAFTVGVHLRTLQPELMIMGVPLEGACRILNGIGDYLLDGGSIFPEQRYSRFIDGYDVMFRPVAKRHYDEYLGTAIWFYRKWGRDFPVYQCIWPDPAGRFPDDTDFDSRYDSKQIDLSR